MIPDAPNGKTPSESGQGTAAAVAEKLDEAARVAEEQTVPVRVALLRGRTSITAAGVALAGFAAVFALVKARRSDEIDAAITLRLQARRHRSLGLLMEAVSWPGFPPQSKVIPPLMMGALWLARLRVEAAFQLLAWGSGSMSEVLKTFTRRPRPLPEQVRVAIAPLGGSSFPSGHVLTYVGTYGFAAYLIHSFVRAHQVRRPVVAGLLAMLALVGPSRIYQGHHWPTDVAASYMLGLTYLIGVTALYRRTRHRWPGRRQYRRVRVRNR
ncbi:MAG TPA: phosphatase PAP2 family protein [Candidatus Limnocylindria bacterium]|nr:phosphatase PAP2 family protein [Candidatus Limnocylindria bacterium]